MTAEIKRYKKKPVEVEAVQIKDLYNKDIVAEIVEWGNGRIQSDVYYNMDPVLKIITSSGHHYASTGDWIIKGIDGNFYATTDENFQSLYEPDDSDTGCSNGIITW